MTAPAGSRAGRLAAWVQRRPGGAAAGIRSVAVVAVTAVVGFLLAGQISRPAPLTAPLEAESESDLARILASLNTESDALRDEISTLRLQLAELQASSEDEQGALTTAERQLASLEVLAGTVPVRGPGVLVSVTDPKGSLRFDTLIDMVQELRDAGAEAIAVNGERVGVASAFSERDGRVVLDDHVLRPPYEIEAIGQPATLDGGLKIPGGAVDAATAVAGVEVTVARRTALELPALDEAPTFRVARPIRSTP